MDIFWNYTFWIFLRQRNLEHIFPFLYNELTNPIKSLFSLFLEVLKKNFKIGPLSWGQMSTIFLKALYIVGYTLKNARNNKSILKIPKWPSLKSLALKSKFFAFSHDFEKAK